MFLSSIFILLYLYITSTKHLFAIYYVSTLAILAMEQGACLIFPPWE